MIKAAVIGWPIEHSRSPKIHGYWLNTYGIDGTYTKIAVAPDDISDFLSTIAEQGLAGCNVTVPHKEAAYKIAQKRDPSAVAVGAANTVWLEDGVIAAANTDTYGFMQHLNLSAPEWLQPDRPVSVLGAGGAARAIAFGLLEAGVKDIRIFNRSRDRSEQLSTHFRGGVTAHAWDERNVKSRDACLVINTTTLGMKGDGDPEIAFETFAPDVVAADIVYVPLQTAFLSRAHVAGCRTVDGLGMLLHQAVPGFEKWFGVRPEVTAELRELIVTDIGRT